RRVSIVACETARQGCIAAEKIRIDINARPKHDLSRHTFAPMRTLAAQIRRELRESAQRIPRCAIYEEELQRYFRAAKSRAEIERFAKQYGFKLRFYKRGLCAIFQENVQNYPST